MSGKAFRRALATAALLLGTTVPAFAASEALAPGIRHFESRRFEEARKVFEPYAAKNPRDADAAYYLGRTLFALGRFEPAVGQLERAAEIRPKADTLLWLGRSYGQFAMQASLFRQAGLAKKCKAAWDRAVVLDPNNLDVREDLIQYYLRAPGFMGGSLEKAREQAAEIRKRDALRGSLAAITIHLHRKENAAVERELAEAIRKATADPQAPRTLGVLHYRLGVIYERNGNKAQARTYYKKAVELDKDLKEAKEALAKLG